MFLTKRLQEILSLLILFLGVCTWVEAQTPFGAGIPTNQASPDQSQMPGRIRITNSDTPQQYPPQQNPTPPKATRDAEPANLNVPGTPIPEEKNEFQQFIFSSTGLSLPIFGQNLFRDVPSTFAPVDRVPVTSDYVIGPGDEIVMRGWGQIDIDYRGVVDRMGNFYVPKVGSLPLAGLKYAQLQPYLKTVIGRVFQNFDLNVTLGQLRSVQIFVVGHARRPGSYTVSSLSTLVNAVFASGGPSSHGSMRHIQLKRGGSIVSDFDLYDLLVNGDKSKDVSLLPGDVIYIPAVGNSVAVTGSVGVPAIYELKDESTFGDALRMAGGMTPTAAARVATVERIRDHSVRSIEEFTFTPEGLARPLMNGDLIIVRPLLGRFENAVTLRGNVASPGRYPLKPGMKISDLIPSRDLLITRSYWMKQQELGNSVPPEKPKDAADRNVKTSEGGQALTEGEQRSAEVQAQLRNDIKRTAPDINWDYAVIQRFNDKQLTNVLIPFNLGRALSGNSEADDVLLQAGDVITIFSQADLKVPASNQTKLVRLEGEFKAAGVYEVLPGETFRQLATRIGGPTQGAYLYGLQFTRESVREAQQKRYDEFVESLDREVERSASEKSQNVVSAEEAAGLKSKIDSQRSLVEKLRRIKVSGRVLLGITSNTTWETFPDFPLEDGDRIFVPYQPATVHVVGAVYSENSFIYQPSRKASYYLRKAGGGTRSADAGRTFIVRADGTVAVRSHSHGWFGEGISDVKLMPGDTMVVPERLDRVSFLKGLKDWSQVIGQFGLGIAAVWTLTR